MPGEPAEPEPPDSGLNALETAREFLKNGAGLAAFSTNLEQLFHEEVKEDFPRASTRGHFEVEPYRAHPVARLRALASPYLAPLDALDGVSLGEDHSTTGYRHEGDLDDVLADDPDEILIFTHGWLARRRAALGRFPLFATQAEEFGYEHPIVGFTWDTSQGVDRWSSALTIARRNGPKLAQFTYDLKQEHPDMGIRWYSNSLGPRVLTSALESLEASGVEDILDSVTVTGAAVDARDATRDGRYGSAIESVIDGQFHNYWLRHDLTLNTFYRGTAGHTALGGIGAVGEMPDNYVDHHPDHVPDHFSYYRYHIGCVDDIVDDFA